MYKGIREGIKLGVTEARGVAARGHKHVGVQPCSLLYEHKIRGSLENLVNHRDN